MLKKYKTATNDLIILVTLSFSNISESVFRIIAKLNQYAKLHGINHCVNKRYHLVERFLWLTFVFSAFSGVFFVGNKQMERYTANPTVISLERDFRLWNGTIPALTFCYQNRFDEVKATNLIKLFWNISADDAEFPYFLNYVRMVVNASISSLNTFKRYSVDKRLEAFDMFLVARDVHPENVATISGFDPNLKLLFNKVMTEKGICFTVNSIILNSGIATNEVEKVQNQTSNQLVTCSYITNQCNMRLEISNKTVKYSFHSPYETVTEYSIFSEMGTTEEVEITLNIVETMASPILRSLSAIQRRCLFYDESISGLEGYSVSICIQKCRAEAAISLCGCKPHFYSFLNGTSCSPRALVCLEEKFWPNNLTCNCPKTCSELVYKSNSFKKSDWAIDSETSILSRDSSLRYEILAQKIRYRRDVLFSFEDLIVSFGGIASLFLGYNFWNTLEMLYYLLNAAINILSKRFQT
ncbi:CLUMA_CG009136, isoform A [Clunio marinus]|uniref:CLUMA_CG009136, isoform A n=1 Tax=Clunio marinus TaxID=568069 RepID=A0A1J1I9N3_9DIPT|nr:CLUMA_CG009136, isoform A [Clunio marinus]